jgi:hypothetical protein
MKKIEYKKMWRRQLLEDPIDDKWTKYLLDKDEGSD